MGEIAKYKIESKLIFERKNMTNPIFTLEEDLSTPVLLSCEHASSYIPEGLDFLGLGKPELKNAKDLFDPGAIEAALKIHDRIGGSLLYSNVSRLVSDTNRPPQLVLGGVNSYHASAVKTELVCGTAEMDELVPIPGNQGLSDAEKLQRYNTYSKPYFETGQKLVKKLLELHGRVVIFSIHSFFPTYHGDVRKTDIDIMFGKQVEKGEALARIVQSKTEFLVEINKPWGLTDAQGGIFGELEDLPGVELYAVDIKNTLLQNGRAENFGELLGASLQEVELV